MCAGCTNRMSCTICTATRARLNNVSGDPAYAGVLAKLKERMLTWYMETGDVVPFDTDMR